MQVLIVEDESLVARCLARALRDHDVTVVDSLDQVAADAYYDLVFCDVGHHADAEISEVVLRSRGDVVLMSGAPPESQTLRSWLNAGAMRWLAKPFMLDAVRTIVEEQRAMPGAGLEPALPKEGNFKFPVSTGSTIRALLPTG